MTLKELLNKDDRFAAANGIQLTEVKEGYAKAEMTVEENHLNGGDVCQGGALFALGDLALAAVMNSHGQLTFGLENTISFLHSAVKGDHLTAEAFEKYNHKKIPFCTVDISNQRGELIATLNGVAYRKNLPMEFDKLD
jgi:acyl-CoA thioesterase